MPRRPSAATVWSIIFGLMAAGALGALAYTWKQSFGLNESYLAAQSDAALLRQNLQSASDRERAGVEKLAVVQAELDSTKKRLEEAQIVLNQMQSNQAAATAAPPSAPAPSATTNDVPASPTPTVAADGTLAQAAAAAPDTAVTNSAASTPPVTNAGASTTPAPPSMQIQTELRPEAAP